MMFALRPCRPQGAADALVHAKVRVLVDAIGRSNRVPPIIQLPVHLRVPLRSPVGRRHGGSGGRRAALFALALLRVLCARAGANLEFGRQRGCSLPPQCGVLCSFAFVALPLCAVQYSCCIKSIFSRS